jgi:hypothetical protein
VYARVKAQLLAVDGTIKLHESQIKAEACGGEEVGNADAEAEFFQYNDFKPKADVQQGVPGDERAKVKKIPVIGKKVDIGNIFIQKG